jgi:glyoxylase-like metal-dependent hydrolase (beta-lactamase superfamily II)
MLYLKSFTFNPFQENSYVLYTGEGQAWIVDPGNSNNDENTQLRNFISEKGLVPEKLLLTHGHIDHVLGNRFIYDTYGLLPEVNEADLFFIKRMVESGAMYGVSCEPSPLPEKFVNDGDELMLGKYHFSCMAAPGHSPGSVCYYNAENKLLVSGDVLFRGSIGRSDLPMGDPSTLINSITTRLLPLPEDVKVYSGHGPPTTIGFERLNNPFLT